MTALKTTLRNYMKWLSLVALILCVCAELPEYCGDGRYDFNNQFCYNNVAYDKCGGGEYNPESHFCHRDTLYELCGGKTYNPTAQKCAGDTVEAKTASFTVTYNGNGNTGGALPVDAAKYPDGKKVVVLGADGLSKTNFTFSRWNTAADGTGRDLGPQQEFTITANTTLYAIWISADVPAYWVNVIGGSGGGGYYPVDFQITITANEAPTGKRFKNWTAQSDGVSFENPANETTKFTMPANIVTVTAVFDTVFTVAYNNNNGEGAAPQDNNKYFRDSLVTVLNADNLARTGYMFNGWNTKADGSGKAYSVDSTFNIISDTTLYAQWKLNEYKVTLKANGGVFTETQDSQIITAEHGKTLGELELPEPTKTDFYFDGWYNTVTYDTKYNNTDTVTSHLTLYARWIFSRFNQTMEYDTLTDTRSGKTQKYLIIKIKNQTWMAENLNYVTASGSYCYNGIDSLCDIYGRLYTWATAMGIGEEYNDKSYDGNDENHQGICADGWHLPNDDDWDSLMVAVGATLSNDLNINSWKDAGEKLKSQIGWMQMTGITSSDEYGFSALPGGGFFTFNNGTFGSVGNLGYWWSATQYHYDQAWYRQMGFHFNYVYQNNDSKKIGYSVRCVKNR